MGAVEMRDPVTERLYAFLLANGSKLVADVLATFVRFHRSSLAIPLDPLSENPETVLHNLDAMMGQITSLCARHDFARLLVLFRRIPHQLALDLIRAVREQGEPMSLFSAAYSKAVLFGTNCALKYCRHEATFRSNNDRYQFSATEDELRDVVLLFLLCTVHRSACFLMNSLVRRELVEPISLDVLLDVYNARLKKRWKPCPTGTVSDVIVFPASVHTLPQGERTWRCRDCEGTERVLAMRNHAPVPCDADLEFRRFAYLDTIDFLKVTGVSFATFRTVWLGLNGLLIHTFPLLWPDDWVVAATPELLAARLEQANDYCESALGGGYPESIWESCHELLIRNNRGSCPTKDECRLVVDFLTYRRFDGDIRFIEQPFVFYPVSDRLLFWDYYRHAGLLRCLARNLTRQPAASATRSKKGKVLELAVMSAVSTMLGVTGVRKCVIRDGGRDMWDIDVGFVYRNILFLVDAKNQHKPVRYYFEATEVSDRVVRWESFLDKLDGNLKENLAYVRRYWQVCATIRGAICLACTEEAEFIASVDRALWLKLYECPRICLLTEMVDFLHQRDAIKELEANTAFVPFLE